MVEELCVKHTRLLLDIVDVFAGRIRVHIGSLEMHQARFGIIEHYLFKMFETFPLSTEKMGCECLDSCSFESLLEVMRLRFVRRENPSPQAFCRAVDVSVNNFPLNLLVTIASHVLAS